MKIKRDFITNSSSTAYIVFIPEHYNLKVERIILLSEYKDYLEDEEPTKKQMLDTINEIMEDIDLLKKGKEVGVGQYGCVKLILHDLLEEENFILKIIDIDSSGDNTFSPITLDELKNITSKVENM